MRRAGPYVILIILHATALGQTYGYNTYYDKDESHLKESISLRSADNKPEGPYLMYHQNGRLAIEGQYTSGVPDGFWSYFYESGLTKSTGYFRLGKADSTWTYFYENGNPKSVGNIVNGDLNGKWIYYYENGTTKSDGYYEKGRMVGLWTYYYETGPIKATTLFNDVEGDHKEFYPSGALKAEGKKNQLESTGEWTYYNEDGTIQSIGHYYRSIKEGPWKTYYPNGQIQSDGQYIQGEKTGKWTYYDEHGAILGGGLMSHDQMDGEWKMFFPDGSLRTAGDYEEGTGTVTDYHSNGQIAISGFMKDGLRDSSWLYYDTQGGLVGKANYSQGTGAYEGYYSDGTLRISGTLDDGKRIGEWKMYDEQGEFTGTYHPIYGQSEPFQPEEPKVEKRDTTIIYDADVSDYKYSKKEIRFFKPVVNEMHAWIFATNPVMILGDFLPISIEQYTQERLGHELQYQWNRAPFLVGNSNIGIEEVYMTGHTLYLRQKFYFEEQPFGMIYLSHHIFGSINTHHVKTQESGGFREIFTSDAREQVVGYGLTLGWRWMLDAGEPGLTFDTYAGMSVARRSWQNTAINDPAAIPFFDAEDQEPLFFPMSFGINIGWATDGAKKKKKRKRR